MMPLFELQDACVRYGTSEALRSATLRFHKGEFVAIAGPNGAGKSTLLSLIAGLTAPSSGRCLFLNADAHKWKRREFAQRVAVVQQTEPTAFPFTVEEVVFMGRVPHRSGLYESATDHAAVESALMATEIAPLRTRDFRTLSGGEKQRVLLASALAQEPEILLLDEPANHLDLQHQVSLHELLRDFSRKGVLVVAVTHDLNLAASYAPRLVLMNEGRICADGAPAEVLDPETMGRIFHVQVAVHHRPSGRPWILYGE
jgi:iron complex transport system ATP-binding protein